jgi:predicted glycosyltransferase
VRIWIDLTAPAHVLVFRPVLERLRAQGHEVEVTARDYAQTLGLLELHGIDHVAFGRHGGAARARKLVSLVSRTRRARGFARGADFDLAIGHGSNELALAAAALGIPAVNTFDYEWAATQHRIGCRFARKVLVPEAIPPERLAPYGASPQKLLRYPGLKEEYYLADFEPDRAVLEELDVDRERILVVLRPPPDVSLYHRKANAIFPLVVEHLGARDDVEAVVLPRTERQREELRSRRLRSLRIAERAVDAQSLVAFADLVVSAGGTMNREAVALGTPVYTTYGGRLGGVDEELMRQGRMRPLVDPTALDLRRRPVAAGDRVRRDPDALVAKMLSAAP